MQRKIVGIISIWILIVSNIARADEGMWLPHLLKEMNEARMKSLGMKITAADIYSINKGSLKDAVVSFGGFCTGEVISSQGLVLTNHHCGNSAIQSHSSLQNNYLKNGFWAQNTAAELPNKSLYVTFIVKIEDVTKNIMQGVTSALSEKERQSIIDKNTAALKSGYKKTATEDLLIKSFFEGNSYLLFVTETFKDVRLVGAPPSSIGNFGQDTDNWMWPRHTGDFSLFRIYADKNNQPAAYSPDNVPYKPKKALTISLNGIQEGDFTMVMGFPGKTTQYLPGVAVEQIRTVNDPAKIAIRSKILTVLDGFMRKDEGIKIQYAAKYASVSNAWKKWQGEVLGLTVSNAFAKKTNFENVFQSRVNSNSSFAQYKNILPDFKAVYAEYEPYALARDYYTEITSRIELFTIISRLIEVGNSYFNGGENAFKQKAAEALPYLQGVLKDFNPQVDKAVFKTLIEHYKTQPEKFVSPSVIELYKKSGNDWEKLTEGIYGKGELYDAASLEKMLQLDGKSFSEILTKSSAVKLRDDMLEHYQKNVQNPMQPLQDKINNLQRTYTQAQPEVMKEKKFYPDANSTLRVAYGQVSSYKPRNGVVYNYFTTLDGVVEKYKPNDYEFDVPEKLLKLYADKDYGRYGINGTMPVCFIASNHTTGGNSGSPALNAYGQLIGLNFDRVWEGTMSDINYDASICRNIMVDIRYVLFIIDKFAGAGHLVKEMNVVQTTAGKK